MDVSLGERLFYDVSKGTSFTISEDLIDIENIKKTFRAYCEHHHGFVVEDKINPTDKLTRLNQMTCEQENPAKALARFSFAKSNGIYHIRHQSKYLVPIYKYILDKNNKEAFGWKIGQEISNGLFEGTVAKVYDTKQIVIMPKEQNIPPMINALNDVLPIDKLELGKDIKSLSELASNLSDDFNSFGKTWFPRVKGMHTGALLELPSSPKYRKFKGYYPFAYLNETFQSYCSAHNGEVFIFVDETTNKWFCVDNQRKSIIAKLARSIYRNLSNETNLSFSANDDDLREFKVLSKVQADNKVGFVKGEQVRSTAYYSIRAKITDSDQYGYRVQTGIDTYKWIGNYIIRKDVDY